MHYQNLFSLQHSSWMKVVYFLLQLVSCFQYKILFLLRMKGSENRIKCLYVSSPLLSSYTYILSLILNVQYSHHDSAALPVLWEGPCYVVCDLHSWTIMSLREINIFPSCVFMYFNLYSSIILFHTQDQKLVFLLPEVKYNRFIVLKNLSKFSPQWSQ